MISAVLRAIVEVLQNATSLPEVKVFFFRNEAPYNTYKYSNWAVSVVATEMTATTFLWNGHGFNKNCGNLEQSLAQYKVYVLAISEARMNDTFRVPNYVIHVHKRLIGKINWHESWPLQSTHACVR